MDKVRLIKKDHEVLKPFDELYMKMHKDGMDILNTASIESLKDIVNAMSKAGTTNCAWTVYRVSRNFLPIARDILKINVEATQIIEDYPEVENMIKVLNLKADGILGVQKQR